MRANVRDFPDNSLILAAVSISAGVPINQPLVTLGIKTAGVLFSLQTAAGAPLQTFSIQPGGGGALTHRLRFTEGFAQSFRKRNTATTVAIPGALADQNVPGTDYLTESGFYSSILPPANGLNEAGLATQGTRLVARFSNVPAGATLYVTTGALPNTGASSALLTTADASGAGPYTAAAQTGTVNVNGAAVGIAPVTLANGSGTATWEILDADPAVLESYTFGVVVVSAQSGAATVVGGLGPISASSVADGVSPVPRFGDTSAQAAACAASPCLTASPGGISMSYQTGTAAPASITIAVGSTASPLAFTASVTAAPEGWLSVTPSSGATPSSLQLTISPAFLYPNVYQANILLTAGAQTLNIPVILTVSVGQSGFVPLGCAATSANPTAVRAEGMTELLGDIVLQCTGGTPTPLGAAIPTVDVKVTLGTPITSRTYANGWSEALLIIDEAGLNNPGLAPQLACSDPSGSCTITGTGTGAGAYSGVVGHPNVFPGKVSGNILTFPNVPLDPPGAGGLQMFFQTVGRLMRVVNLRTDTTGYPADQFTAVPASVSVGPVAVTNAVSTAGFIFPSLRFSLRSADNSAASSGPALTACVAPAAQRAGVLRFSEAFRMRSRTGPSRRSWTRRLRRRPGRRISQARYTTAKRAASSRRPSRRRLSTSRPPASPTSARDCAPASTISLPARGFLSALRQSIFPAVFPACR